jgi:hypothetical protein
VFFDRGLDEHASTVFPDASDSARQLVREAQVHAGLGYDYVVSPGMASARIDRSKRWPNDLGACTPYEAFRLAGVKARMYDSVPLFADPDALFSVNVGMWYDLAVMHFTPGLIRAIGGALAPSAAHDEHLVGEHLLAIRVRLSELLQARDAIYRLTRREALGPLRGSTFAEGPIVGPRGNDLTAQMSYHLTAALDSAFAAIDNAVWVVVRGDDPAKSRGSVGLGTLLDPKPSAWTRRPSATTAIRLLARNSSLPFTLAARALRNNMVHREGLDFGTIDWHPSADAPVHGLSGIWVTRDQLPPLELSIGRVDLFGGLAHSGRLCGQDMVVMTYQRFVDGLWDSTTRTVGSCLSAREWSSRGWTWSDPVVMNAPREWHLWRTPMQRRLWGL